MKTKTYVKGVAALCALAAVACTGVQQSRGDVAVYLDESQPLEKRVEDALSRLTLEEKVGLLHAQSKFSSAGVPRLGIPEVWCTDGPHGIRPEVLWDEWDQAGWTNDSCTAFPALTCLAATWNPEMSALYGKSIGEEARYRDKDVLLGPGGQHLPHAPERAQLRVYGRRPLPVGPHGRALRAGGTAERGCRLREALCREQPGAAAP